MSKFVVGHVYVDHLEPCNLFLLLKIEQKHDEKSELAQYQWYELTFLVSVGNTPYEITLLSDGYFCTFCEKLC